MRISRFFPHTRLPSSHPHPNLLFSVMQTRVYYIIGYPFSFAVLNLISGEVQSYWEQPYAQPYFDNSTKREVTATVGQSALLHCRVRNLGDRAVSNIIIATFSNSKQQHIYSSGRFPPTLLNRYPGSGSVTCTSWPLVFSPTPTINDSNRCTPKAATSGRWGLPRPSPGIPARMSAKCQPNRKFRKPSGSTL